MICSPPVSHVALRPEVMRFLERVHNRELPTSLGIPSLDIQRHCVEDDAFAPHDRADYVEPRHER